jgi:hypothetical protein
MALGNESIYLRSALVGIQEPLEIFCLQKPSYHKAQSFHQQLQRQSHLLSLFFTVSFPAFRLSSST